MIKIIIVCVTFYFCLSAQAEYGGGTGEPNSPYEVNDLAHLQYLSGNYWNWDKCFVLTADIDAPPDSNVGLIGNYFVRFTGTFDGRGHVIRGLHIDSNSLGWFGLFGYTGPSAQISNLSLTYASIVVDADSYGGLLVGQNEGTISYCSSSGLARGHGGFGGLVGVNFGGTITECYSVGAVYSHEATAVDLSFVGGLVGYNDSGTITNSYSAASVCAYGTIFHYSIGGLVGQNTGSITNCYSTGSVSDAGNIGVDYAGGLVGRNGGTITKCYSSGVVACHLALVNAGGLVGWDDHSVTFSFWDIATSGWDTSDGGKGLKTARMKLKRTFTDAGWDFRNTWQILEGVTYPYLHIGIGVDPPIPGDLDGDGDVDFDDFAIFTNNWLAGVE